MKSRYDINFLSKQNQSSLEIFFLRSVGLRKRAPKVRDDDFYSNLRNSMRERVGSFDMLSRNHLTYDSVTIPEEDTILKTINAFLDTFLFNNAIIVEISEPNIRTPGTYMGEFSDIENTLREAINCALGRTKNNTYQTLVCSSMSYTSILEPINNRQYLIFMLGSVHRSDKWEGIGNFIRLVCPAATAVYFYSKKYANGLTKAA